ncbi:MAG TPA: DNRLRE domain-containing protein [Pirellulaceae bacterium]|nr:DNRLRE domain-containing protein [Pirellulaceae bacterium]
MRHRRSIVALCIVNMLWLAQAVLPCGEAADEKNQVLFNFASESAAKDWTPVKLPEVAKEQPAPTIEIATAKAGDGQAGKCLKITFAGGDWPAVGTTTIPVQGNWKPFQTLQAEVTVDRPGVAYFRICQGRPDDKSQQPRWEKTMNLLPGRNEVTLMLRHGIGSLDPDRGDVTSFIIGMFRPEKGQSLLVGNVRLSTDWPPPKVLGWYSPYNHDGYSAAAAREYARTGEVAKFKVLGTDLEVNDVPDLARRLKDKWARPEPMTIEQVEDGFRAEFDKLKRDHPRAVLAVLREGEKGFHPSHPDKAYEGWRLVYVNCHGPDGPNPGRENTPAPSETVEVFMRHRSVLMRVDLASIPKDANVLAAKLVITRVQASDLKPPDKPNLWVAEPCNRDWDETQANCYFFAKGKHWKGVSGLYYGADPDFWPVFLSHGPAGGGAVSAWDFTEAVKFWLDGKHANHGFFLHGDSNDYMLMYTPRVKDLKQRPALMVIYEPRA